jgi:hypothetical protein
MYEAIFLDEFFTLSAFTCAWRAKDYKIDHRGTVELSYWALVF